MHEVELTIPWRHEGKLRPPKTRLWVSAATRAFMRGYQAVRDTYPGSASVQADVGAAVSLEPESDAQDDSEEGGGEDSEDPESSSARPPVGLTAEASRLLNEVP